MVEWYSPPLLLKAAFEVVVSTIFGQHADQRTVQALTAPAKIFDYSSGERRDIVIHPQVVSLESGSADTQRPEQPPQDFWIDYIADIGDGWNSTYSVAWLATRPQSPFRDPKGVEHPTEQGRLIIFGGDQVYPTASRNEYERRFLMPYRTAFSDGESRNDVDVFAIPGNHDWYDSLKSFSRIFFTSSPFADIAGTLTPQTRSYFAIKLPGHWWLLGTDVQLGSDIDANQLEYFRTVKEHFSEHDRVILCTAEPHWLKPKRTEKRESLKSESALDQLERELLQGRVAVFIAGDVHHYMRYESAAGSKVHKITAGGGGAFLHPTHRTWDRKLQDLPARDTSSTTAPRQFQQQEQSVFPTPIRSQILGLRNLLFAGLNPRFGLLTAILYVLFTLMMLPAFVQYSQNVKLKEDTELKERLTLLEGQYRTLLESVSQDAQNQPEILAEVERQKSKTSELWAAAGNQSSSSTHIGTEASQLVLDLQNKLRPLANDTSAASTASDPTTASNRWQANYQAAEELRNRVDEYQEKIQEASPLDKEGYFSRAAAIWSEKPNEPEVLPQSTEVLASDSASPSNPETGSGESPPPSEHNMTASSDKPESPWNFLLKITLQEAKLPRPFESMMFGLVIAAAIAGFVAFTDIPHRGGRFALGTAHAIVHWFAAYLLTFTITFAGFAAFEKGPPTTTVYVLLTLAILLTLALTVRIAWTDESNARTLSRIALSVLLTAIYAAVLITSMKLGYDAMGLVMLIFVFGWFIGSTVMGAYLFLTHTLTGQHWNETFSSIHCQDWKCFVRFKIATDGSLTIYPIGIPRVCRKWNDINDTVQPKSELKSGLIEAPLVIQ